MPCNGDAAAVDKHCRRLGGEERDLDISQRLNGYLDNITPAVGVQQLRISKFREMKKRRLVSVAGRYDVIARGLVADRYLGAPFNDRVVDDKTLEVRSLTNALERPGGPPPPNAIQTHGRERKRKRKMRDAARIKLKSHDGFA